MQPVHLPGTLTPTSGQEIKTHKHTFSCCCARERQHVSVTSERPVTEVCPHSANPKLPRLETLRFTSWTLWTPRLKNKIFQAFTKWTLYWLRRHLSDSEGVAAVIRLQVLTCSSEGSVGSGTASFQGFQSLFFVDLVYIVFIASPRECFSLTLLLFYLAKKKENSESASYCLHNLPTIIIVRRHYCLMAAINLFLIHTSACFALIFLLKLKRQRFKILCVCVCTPLLLFSIIWAAVLSGGFG